MNDKKVNVNIVDGDEFFGQEVSISYNPTLFNIDFRRITSRVDMRSNDANVVVLRHNVVILEPYVVKNLIEIMQKSVERYETEFGKIEIPEQIKKLEKKVKKEIEGKSNNNTNKNQNNNVIEYKNPSYFG